MRSKPDEHANADRSNVLSLIGKPVEVITGADGVRVQVLPYGGRILGLFAPGDNENFLWTNPALKSAATARAFYASEEWHNSGGDRAWIAPEADFFYPYWPETNVYVPQRRLDPSCYTLERNHSEVRLTNRMRLRRYSCQQDVNLTVTRSVTLTVNPLREESDCLADSLSYAGYTLHSTLRVYDPPERMGVGLWNLLQLPHGGQMLISTFSRAQPTVYFGLPANQKLAVNDRMVNWSMRGHGDHKIGLRAMVCTGRVGYLYRSGARWTFILRNFLVNPSGDYVDTPPGNVKQQGCAVQACAVNNAALGRFSELEYHTPAISRNTGTDRIDDVSQVWAFRDRRLLFTAPLWRYWGGNEMETMKVVRLLAPGNLTVMDMPRPVPGPHQVLCRIKRVGVCGTDYSIYTGEASFVKSGAVHFPMTLGHEWSGTVFETGPDVEQFKTGDRVVGDTGVACGYCTECLLGQWPKCRKFQAVGTVYAWDGGYAEYILMPERHLFPLPDSVSFDNGALVEPAATALYSVKKAQVQIGDTVLVQGSGPIGILAARLAKLSGASKVAITGRKDEKLRTAVGMGIDGAINTKIESVTDGLCRIMGVPKVDRVIEASGSTELFRESLGLINPGGALSVVAFYDKPLKEFDLDSFVFSDIIMAAVPGSLGMFPPVLKLMESGVLDASQIITERAPLFEVTERLPRLKDGADKRIKVMLELE